MVRHCQTGGKLTTRNLQGGFGRTSQVTLPKSRLTEANDFAKTRGDFYIIFQQGLCAVRRQPLLYLRCLLSVDFLTIPHRALFGVLNTSLAAGLFLNYNSLQRPTHCLFFNHNPLPVHRSLPHLQHVGAGRQPQRIQRSQRQALSGGQRPTRQVEQAVAKPLSRLRCLKVQDL